MTEILKLLNTLSADELDSVIMRANIMLEKKRKEEAEQAILAKERERLEKIEQEKRRLEEIAELQRKIAELQSQTIVIPDAPVQPAPEKPQAPEMVSCPHCHLMNVATSQYCANCGQRISKRSQQQSTPQAAPQPVQPVSRPEPQPQSAEAQVRCADESMEEWEKLPGEETEQNNHEIILLQPDGGKYAYYMEVTNKRILFMRESTGSKNAGYVARMGGGLLGSLIAEGIKSAVGAGPKPWLEIPLAAVKDCGVQDKKEFFIEADQKYVLKNKGYEKVLPALVMAAKR